MKFSIGWWIMLSEGEKMNRAINHIERLDIPVRISHALKMAGIVTIEHLINYLTTRQTPNGKSFIRQFGSKSEMICRDALLAQGYVAPTKTVPPEYARLPNDQWKICLDYWHHCCAACGKSPTEYSPLHQDHWIPRNSLMFLGSDMNNIIPLCWACNVEKADQGPYLWLVAKFGHLRANAIMRAILDYFDWVSEYDQSA